MLLSPITILRQLLITYRVSNTRQGKMWKIPEIQTSSRIRRFARKIIIIIFIIIIIIIIIAYHYRYKKNEGSKSQTPSSDYLSSWNWKLCDPKKTINWHLHDVDWRTLAKGLLLQLHQCCGTIYLLTSNDPRPWPFSSLVLRLICFNLHILRDCLNVCVNVWLCYYFMLCTLG